MRILYLLLALPLLALPAHAQTTPGAKPAHTHLTRTQRFEQANVTHDGHLTAAQAKAGDHSVARHFAEIDQGNKGYVTEDEIRAWYKAKHAQPHASSSQHSHSG